MQYQILMPAKKKSRGKKKLHQKESKDKINSQTKSRRNLDDVFKDFSELKNKLSILQD